LARAISIFMENFYCQSQRKTKNFFDTAKVAESEEKGMRKIRRFRQIKISTCQGKMQHFPQPKILHCQRYIYIYRKILLPESKTN
ncbi:hypothetical protein, partial [Okeania sp. SIO3I5]|uniref:hypothetical protein n=1 Tax=Okeania sp. SIO3I5 TaxID=2607805 RepID=UPI0025F5D522